MPSGLIQAWSLICCYHLTVDFCPCWQYQFMKGNSACRVTWWLMVSVQSLLETCSKPESLSSKENINLKRMVQLCSKILKVYFVFHQQKSVHKCHTSTLCDGRNILDHFKNACYTSQCGSTRSNSLLYLWGAGNGQQINLAVASSLRSFTLRPFFWCLVVTGSKRNLIITFHLLKKKYLLLFISLFDRARS